MTKRKPTEPIAPIPLQVCAWCKQKYKGITGEWFDGPELVAKAEKLGQASHGMCNVCYEKQKNNPKARPDYWLERIKNDIRRGKVSD